MSTTSFGSLYEAAVPANPGGAADRAGLCEGEIVDPPRYPEIVRLNLGDLLDIGVTRNGETARISIPLIGETAPVPQWRKPPGTAS